MSTSVLNSYLFVPCSVQGEFSLFFCQMILFILRSFWFLIFALISLHANSFRLNRKTAPKRSIQIYFFLINISNDFIEFPLFRTNCTEMKSEFSDAKLEICLTKCKSVFDSTLKIRFSLYCSKWTCAIFSYSYLYLFICRRGRFRRVCVYATEQSSWNALY